LFKKKQGGGGGVESMGEGGGRGKHAFFSSILFFEHAHFLLVFSLLFSCFCSSKKKIRLSLDAPITMKINKKGQKMRNI